jgi:putative membrane protein
VSTLVVCVDRGGDLADGEPVVGRDAIERLVMEVGMTDPETSRVNSFLETLRVADDIEADGEEAIVAVVSGGGDGVDADRAVARQTDELVDEYAPDSAVVVTDSAEDERLVPIVESRVQVDAVDRVVVRQSHDIESTYYVLKQFLADEELRATVLVPIGAALLAFPVLLLLADSLAVAVSAIAAVIGVFLLYKGLGVDDWLAALPGAVRDAFYSGQVSLVTYVVGAGLATVGLFAGAIDISNTAASPVIMGMRFVFAAVPWLALAALTASTGRLIDEFLDEERVPNAFLNLPFGVVAVGLVVRGFSAYFLERAGEIPPVMIPATELGPVSVEGFTVSVWTRLAAFVLLGIAISLGGVRFTSYITAEEGESVEEEFPES